MAHHSQTRHSTSWWLLPSLSLLALVFTGCGGALYKVKPVVELPPLSGDLKTATAGDVTVRVAPLLSDEESQDLFEANLPLSGVLPVRMELQQQGGEPLDLKRARFQLSDDQGRKWKLLKPKEAVSRILSANGVTLYNPHSRKRFEEEFSAYGIDFNSPLTPSERRQGFLFFRTPNKEPVASPRGLVLLIERLLQPIEIKVN